MTLGFFGNPGYVSTFALVLPDPRERSGAASEAAPGFERIRV